MSHLWHELHCCECRRWDCGCAPSHSPHCHGRSFCPTGHTPTMPACDTNAAQTRSQFIPRCPRRPRRPGSRGLALTGRALDTLDTGHSDRRTGFHFRKGQVSALRHGHGQKNAGNAGNDPSPGSYGPRQVFYRGGCMKPARSMDVPLGWC